MNAKIYLDSKPDTDGKCQLFFHITGNGTKAKVSSNIKVSPENWINGTIHKKEPNFDIQSSILQTKFGMLTRLIAEAELKLMKPSPAELKKAYLEKIKTKQQEKTITGKHGLVAYFDYYKEQYKNIQKPNSIRALKQVRDHIEKYDPEITLEDINQSWLVGYCNYLIELELEDSTIKDRHLKAIKSVCNEGIRNKIPVSMQVANFSWKAQRKQPFFATWDEVLAIQGITDFVLPIQEKVRDLFILSCHTGLRDSDLRQISPNNFTSQGDQKMLRVIMVKTDFDYSIPVSDIVWELLKKYNFKAPKVSQQAYNREIKNIAQIVVKGESQKTKSSGSNRKVIRMPRHKRFTTHTGRRTFGRKMLDGGASLIIVSKIFGHKTLETTLNYIGFVPQEVVTEFRKVFG